MDELRREIAAEKEHIRETLQTLQTVLERRKKTVVELAAISTFVQNTYNGMENILKRILKFKGVEMLPSDSSHKNLLGLSVKNKIMSLELSKKFDEYRAFRHFFVHGYGIMLDKEKVLPLAENLPKVWNEFEKELAGLMSSIGKKES